MNKTIYGLINEDEDVDINNMIFFSSLEELLKSGHSTEGDHIFIFQLVDEGVLDLNPRFVSNKKKANKK